MKTYRVTWHSLMVDGPVTCSVTFKHQWSARLLCWWLNRNAARDSRGGTHTLVRRGENMILIKWYSSSGMLLGSSRQAERSEMENVREKAKLKSRNGFASLQFGKTFEWFKKNKWLKNL